MIVSSVCTKCGSVGAKGHVKGSLAVEIVLWLCFLIPGLIYSVWRHSSKGSICASCGSSELIPVTSPAGKKLCEKYGTLSQNDIDLIQWKIDNPTLKDKLIKYRWIVILFVLFVFPILFGLAMQLILSIFK